jgi:hypothetical protein
MQLRFEGDERKTLIARFGLPADASDTDIGTKVQEHLLAAEESQPPADPPTVPATTPSGPQGPTVPGGDPGTGGTGGGGEPTPQQPAKPGSAATEPDDGEEDDEALEGQVVMDPEAFKVLNQRAAQASKLEEEARVSKRDSLIAGAVKAGKFPPSRREHYAKLFDSDPEGTERTIKRLQANVIPLDQRGVEAIDLDAQDDSYPTQWLPERPQVTGGANGTGQPVRQSRVTTED